MGIIVRQSILNSLITYTGIGLGAILTLLLFPHILDPDQYGLTRVLVSASLISAQFAHLGIRNTIIRFFPLFTRSGGPKHGLLFWAVTVPLAGFLIFGVLFWIFQDAIISYYAEESPLFVNYYLWILPITLFILYFEVLNSYLRSLRDSTTGSMVNEVLQRILVIAFLGIYFFGWIRFSHFILLFSISYAIQPLILTLQIYRLGELRLTPNLTILRKPLLKGMSNYSLYSLFGGITTVLVWNVDIMMLGSMAGLADTAVYAIAFYIGSVIAVPQRSIEKIATPMVADFIQNREWENVAGLYQKTSLNQLIAGLLVFGLIWINIDLLFALLPEEYAGGKWVVFIIGLGKMVDLATGINGGIIVHSKHYRVAFYTNLILVGLTILANLLLIPRYGITGAAIATLFSLFSYNFIKFLFVWAKLKMQPFGWPSVVAAVLGTVTIALASQFFTFQSPLLSIPVKNGFFLLTFLMPLLYFNLSPDLNRLLMNRFRK